MQENRLRVVNEQDRREEKDEAKARCGERTAKTPEFSGISEKISLTVFGRTWHPVPTPHLGYFASPTVRVPDACIEGFCTSIVTQSDE